MCVDKTTITVGSVTYAIKARRLFMRMNIKSKLVKLDAKKSKNGCTHGLEFSTEDFYAAVMGLKNAGINYSIY